MQEDKGLTDQGQPPLHIAPCLYKSMPDLLTGLHYTCVCLCIYDCVSEARQSKKTGNKKKAQLLVQQPLIANLDGALFLVKGEKYLQISPRITYSK